MSGEPEASSKIYQVRSLPPLLPMFSVCASSRRRLPLVRSAGRCWRSAQRGHRQRQRHMHQLGLVGGTWVRIVAEHAEIAGIGAGSEAVHSKVTYILGRAGRGRPADGRGACPRMSPGWRSRRSQRIRRATTHPGSSLDEHPAPVDLVNSAAGRGQDVAVG